MFCGVTQNFSANRLATGEEYKIKFLLQERSILLSTACSYRYILRRKHIHYDPASPICRPAWQHRANIGLSQAASIAFWQGTKLSSHIFKFYIYILHSTVKIEARFIHNKIQRNMYQRTA